MKKSLLRSRNFKEAYEYAKGVADGSIIVNKYRVKCCQRFLDDLENEEYDFRLHTDFIPPAIPPDNKPNDRPMHIL